MLEPILDVDQHAFAPQVVQERPQATFRHAHELGDLPRARKTAEEAAALDPAFYEPEELLARIAKKAGDASGAAEHARKALEREPPFAAVRAELEAIASGK